MISRLLPVFLTLWLGCAPSLDDDGSTASSDPAPEDTAAPDMECTATPGEYRSALCDVAEGTYATADELAACESYDERWVDDCETQGELCAYTCAHRHGADADQCAVADELRSAAELESACTAACDAALAVGTGSATWDGDTRHVDGEDAPLTNREDVLLFVACSWETVCSYIDEGYCYASY